MSEVLSRQSQSVPTRLINHIRADQSQTNTQMSGPWAHSQSAGDLESGSRSATATACISARLSARDLTFVKSLHAPSVEIPCRVLKQSFPSTQRERTSTVVTGLAERERLETSGELLICSGPGISERVADSRARIPP